MARLTALSKLLSGSDFDQPMQTAPAELTKAEKVEAERLAVVEDLCLVNEEIDQYKV
jgi:hypothetical protein